MSMIGHFRRLEESGIGELASCDEDEMASRLFGEDEPEADLDVDKAWHAIHFLLCGSADEASGPLGSAILGGTPIGPDLGYGPARWLSADQVRAVAKALPEPAELISRYDSQALTDADVYPQIWDEPDDEISDFLGSHYEALRRFYAQAAAENQAMLLWLA